MRRFALAMMLVPVFAGCGGGGGTTTPTTPTPFGFQGVWTGTETNMTNPTSIKTTNLAVELLAGGNVCVHITLSTSVPAPTSDVCRACLAGSGTCMEGTWAGTSSTTVHIQLNRYVHGSTYPYQYGSDINRYFDGSYSGGELSGDVIPQDIDKRVLVWKLRKAS